jgi:2-oxoglutarate dehydrogenase E2 component (dihydrolipoamide succinyltransferase)
MIQLIMPKMGESVAEATILKWLKNEGDKIEADEPVLEIATDKVDSEVPSPSAGVLSKRMFEEGQVVKVGEVIALIEGAGEQKQSAPASAPAVPAAAPSGNGFAQPSTPAPVMVAPVEMSRGTSAKFFSPLVRTIAKQEGVSIAELEALKGSGANDRVTKQDLLNYISGKGKMQPGPSPARTSTPASAPSPLMQGPAISVVAETKSWKWTACAS